MPLKQQDCFIPHRLVETNADTIAVDSLGAFPFLNSQSILSSLKVEFSTYLALAQDISPEYDTYSMLVERTFIRCTLLVFCSPGRCTGSTLLGNI